MPGRLQGINEPFLILGQVENTDEDDGLLALSEVLDLRLDAEMVVLSACVTGRGEATEGEGVVNFARAFHQAGARSVVVSLWGGGVRSRGRFHAALLWALASRETQGRGALPSQKGDQGTLPRPLFLGRVYLAWGGVSPAARPSGFSLLDHLGLVAGMCDELGIGDVLNRATQHKPEPRMVTVRPRRQSDGPSWAGCWAPTTLSRTDVLSAQTHAATYRPRVVFQSCC